MTNRRAMIGAIGIAALVAMLLPILFGAAPTVAGTTGGDPWRNWIYDFQTLISGLAAVMAATATILVMQRTDARQERRHHEILELSLRPDRLLVERALVPQVQSLETTNDILTRLQGDMFEKPDREGQKSVLYSQNWMIKLVCTDLVEFFERPALREGLRLFNGDLSYKIFWLEKKTRATLLVANEVSLITGGGRSAALEPVTDRDWFFMGEELHDFVIEAHEALHAIIIMMKALGARYRVGGF